MVYITKTGIDNAEDMPNSDAYDNLSVREREIVSLLRQGLTYAVIAEKLSISVHTVKTHLQHIYRKFGVNSRSALMFYLTGAD
jgi:DNA-binding CsgD family transcriptional regulator